MTNKLLRLLICLLSLTICTNNIPNSATETVANLIELSSQECKKEHFQTALEHLQNALLLDPNNPDIVFKMGYVQLYLGNLSEALTCYLTIAKDYPQYKIPSLYNAGYILKIMGKNALAIEIFNKILTIVPQYESAHLGLAFALINQGKFAEGWQAHEWNLIQQGKNAPELRKLLKEGTLVGKRIILTPEGGLGDTLNFFRYGKRLTDLGAQVTAVVQRPLFNLLKNCSDVDCVIPSNSPLPAHDARVSYMSIPALLGDTQETIPKAIPYIHADVALVKQWGEYLGKDKNFKVGISWQASIYNDSSRLPIARRGIPLNKLATLHTVPNTSFYSLQQEDGVDELKDMPKNFNLHVFDETFDKTHGSFTDTAALIENLDLVITIDSAVAHLTAALGKQVWLLLPYNTDWRWIAGQTTSPWYPTMRIFKQPHPFDWDSVIKQVLFELTIVTQLNNSQ